MEKLTTLQHFHFDCAVCFLLNTMEFTSVACFSFNETKCEQDVDPFFLKSCSFCDKKFVFDWGLAAHKKLHKPPGYLCELCDTTLPSQENYNLHQKLLHGADIFIEFLCEFCGFLFTRKEILNDHVIEYHAQEERSQPSSQPSFTMLEELVDDLTMKCNECGAVYFSDRSLKLHKRKRHSGGAFKCSICSCAYQTKSGLRLHRTIKHEFCRSRRIATGCVCDLCGYSFTARKHLRLHEQRAHVPDGFPCEACYCTFANEKAYKIHYRKIHSKL